MFTHLHVHTQYSLLDGACKISKLVSRAKELGMEALAITDHGVMYGVVDFYQECEKQGIKPIIGCEVYMAEHSRFERKHGDEIFHLILLAENNVGYHNLMKLCSCGHLEGFYNKPRIDKDLLRAHSEGLICLSACIQGEVAWCINNNNLRRARHVIEEYIDIFGKDNYYLEIQNHALEYDAKVNAALLELAEEYGLGVVATNDLHYVDQEDAEAQDVLLCIQTNALVSDANRFKFPNNSFYLKSEEEMAQLFPNCPQALSNTNLIAERCKVTLEFGKYLIPDYDVPEGYDAQSYLRKLCEDGLKTKYPELTPEVRERLEYELGIIHQMGYDCYFLIVWDFINFCREAQIPVGPGRGSAAGSIVAYLLDITKIEPLHYNLLFERFLNPERVSMPDIDTDFETERRLEVLKYVIRKYGTDRVAQIITYGTLQAKGALHDVGRALGMPNATVSAVTKLVPKVNNITLEQALKDGVEFRQAYETDPDIKRLVDLARSVEGMPRNVGTHAAGVIIAPADLSQYVPLRRDTNQEGIITQYDMSKVEGLGLLKMDFLGLKTLTVIDNTIKLVKESLGIDIDMDHIPLDDEKTCAMLRRGDTFGVFQLESEGITELLVKLEPKHFEDLIALVALYRPGPLQTGMAEDFVAGRHGNRTAKVLHPLMEPILKDTYGVILYQEQVMQITSALAGFSLGQADILRRAMGKKKASVLASMRQAFVEGAAKEHGVPEALSNEIFDMLQKFAGYGFNKSHSVAYGLVAYQTAYLKANYPVHFMAAYLNSVIDNPEKISWYINVCRNAGMDILPPDVNSSSFSFNVAGEKAIRFGLGGIKNVGEKAVAAIVSERQKGGTFKSLEDFCCRVNMREVNKRVIENLVLCGAMDCFGRKRSELRMVAELEAEYGAAYQKDQASGQLNLFGEDSGFNPMESIVIPQLDELPSKEKLQYEKELLGFYVTGHPLDEFRPVLKRYMALGQFIDNKELEDGMFVDVAGIISDCRIRNTKAGATMANLVLEDFSGRFPVIVFPKSYSQNARELYADNIVGISGRLRVEEDEVLLVANLVYKLTPQSSPKLARAQARNRQNSGNDYAVLDNSYGNAGYPGYAPEGYDGGGYSGVPIPEGYSGPIYPEAGAGPVQVKEAGYTDGQTPLVEPDKEITIIVNERFENDLTFRKLGKLFQAYRGNDAVRLKLMKSRKYRKVSSTSWVDSDAPGFKQALERILGPGCIE